MFELTISQHETITVMMKTLVTKLNYSQYTLLGGFYKVFDMSKFLSQHSQLHTLDLKKGKDVFLNPGSSSY